ncbi:MAG: Endolytic murein transglycosylase [Owenweeksia sp. TMED14]|nr:MAG: Endolytic murein transglycosylase [Owenweeksia sp. TMED14]|tara:strand:- start:128 stop:1138 length:1011 start_codon:yes stop_codon:yes gene_type:complete
MRSKNIFPLILSLILLGIVSLLMVSNIVDSSIQTNGRKNISIFVPTEGTSISELLDSLESVGEIKYSYATSILANLKGYDSARFGHYTLDSTLGRIQFLRKLNFGYEDPIDFSIKGYRDKQSFLRELKYVFPWSLDSLEHYVGSNDSWTHIIPNTYEIYWSSTPDEISKRIQREFDAFWGSYRRRKAEELGLSPNEIMILASISQAETKAMDELPRVAALYISRLRIGKRLESDPTAVYAYRDIHPESDIIRRVSRKITRIVHPYNTYIIPGLPPSPIATVDPAVIDAVLRAEPKGELYMCADPNRIGYHNFTASYREHLINSSKYHRSLNRRKIH